MHIISLHFALYIGDKYDHYRPNHSIRVASYSHEAQSFLQNKYNWSSSAFHSINYNIYFSSLCSLPDFLKRLTLRFIHHRISAGKILFETPITSPYCNLSFTSPPPPTITSSSTRK